MQYTNYMQHKVVSEVAVLLAFGEFINAIRLELGRTVQSTFYLPKLASTHIKSFSGLLHSDLPGIDNVKL